MRHASSRGSGIRCRRSSSRRASTEFEGDLEVGGADLAGQFVRRGLVDEFQLMIHPVVLGAGTPFWPMLDDPLRLRLTESRRFASGVMLLSYAAA